MKSIPRQYLIVTGVIVVLVVIIGFFMFGQGKAENAENKKTVFGEPAEVIPTVDSSVKATIVGSKDGVITIKNSQYPEGFVLKENYITFFTDGDLEVRLDDNEYFVLGDNRPSSHDSRRWGTLAESYVIGKVYLRAWPFNKFEFIDDVMYNIP